MTASSKRASAALASTKDGAHGDKHLERVRALRGDLDNIVAKALKKAPGERYATADAFAQDLHRYLNDEPVSARAAVRPAVARAIPRRARMGVLTPSVGGR